LQPRRRFLRSRVAECVQNERGTTFALQKNTLSFEQQNMQLGSDRENTMFPPLAFTHAFKFLIRFLTALSMASCPDHLQCLFQFSHGFYF